MGKDQVTIKKGEVFRVKVTAQKLPGCNTHVDLTHEGKKVTFYANASGRTTKEAVDRAVASMKRTAWFPVLKKHGAKFQLVGKGLAGKNIRKVF